MYEYDESDDTGYETLTHPAGGFKASFDLTTFGDAETWQAAMGRFGFAHDEYRKSAGTGHTARRFLWHNDELVVQTCNNPLTGEYYDPEMRNPEEGYASYIHVIGEEAAVAAFYEWVKEHAQHIKEASLGKWVV